MIEAAEQSDVVAEAGVPEQPATVSEAGTLEQPILVTEDAVTPRAPPPSDSVAVEASLAVVDALSEA